MNKILKSFMVVILLIVIQISILNNIKIGMQTGNLLLMYVVYVSQKEGKYSGVIIGMILGLIYDTLLSNSLGVRAISFSMIGYFIGIVSDYLYLENSFVLSIYAIISTVIHKLILSLVYFFQSYEISFYSILTSIVNYELILNIGIILIIYYTEKKFNFSELFISERLRKFE